MLYLRLADKCLEGQMSGGDKCRRYIVNIMYVCITLFTLERNVVVLLWHPQEAPGIRSPHQLLTESKDVRPNFTGEVLFKVLFIASHIANTLMWRGLMIFSFAAAVKFPAISISCKSEQQMRKPNRWHEIEKLPPQPRDTPGLRPCRQQLHSSPWVDLIGYFSHNKHLHLLHPPRPQQFTLHNVAVECQTRVFLH